MKFGIKFTSKSQTSINALLNNFRNDKNHFEIQKKDDVVTLLLKGETEENTSEKTIYLNIDMKDVIFTADYEGTSGTYRSLDPELCKRLLMENKRFEVIESPINTGVIYNKDFISYTVTLRFNKDIVNIDSLLEEIKKYFDNIAIADNKLAEDEKEVYYYTTYNKNASNPVISFKATAKIADMSVFAIIDTEARLAKELFNRFEALELIQE